MELSHYDLLAELFWDTPGDPDPDDGQGTDMDLHLLDVDVGFLEEDPQFRIDYDADGDWFCRPKDCWWDNPAPDWGAPGDATDDPRQLVDRTQTPGPEHITLDNPEAGNVYWVGSYYASPRGLGPSLPRIRLYAEGALVWEGSRAQDIADQFWEGATIEWPSLAVTETDELFPDYSITDRFGRVRNCPQ